MLFVQKIWRVTGVYGSKECLLKALQPESCLESRGGLSFLLNQKVVLDLK